MKDDTSIIRFRQPEAVRRPKIRDRAADTGDKVRFTSHILPRWARRSLSLDVLLPVLYLRGISTGDFQEALAALLGPDARNLSPGVISRLTSGPTAFTCRPGWSPRPSASSS